MADCVYMGRSRLADKHLGLRSKPRSHGSEFGQVNKVIHCPIHYKDLPNKIFSIGAFLYIAV